jgi:hypothetical protein
MGKRRFLFPLLILYTRTCQRLDHTFFSWTYRYIAEASAMIAQQRLEFPTIPTRIFIVVYNIFQGR